MSGQTSSDIAPEGIFHPVACRIFEGQGGRWTWVDPFTWGSKPLDQQYFFCFCDDNCFYRKNMGRRGPNLDRAMHGLPGISISVNPQKCEGCGTCVASCFAGEMKLVDGVATPQEKCKACGMCVEVCPNGALDLVYADEETLFNNLLDRIRERTSILGPGE